jgi:CheY-like chemotaxis protein
MTALKILIADDNAGIRQVIRRVLTADLDAQVREVTSGIAALEALDEERFDLAILDIEMGTLDGADTLEAIRSAEHLQSLPVVMVSGAGSEPMVKRLKAMGVNGFIAKPLSLAVLRERLVPLVRTLAPPRPAPPRPPSRPGVELQSSSQICLVGGGEEYWKSVYPQLRRACTVAVYQSGIVASTDIAANPPEMVLVAATATGTLTPVLLARILRRGSASRARLVLCGSSDGLKTTDRELFDAETTLTGTPTVAGLLSTLRTQLSDAGMARVLLHTDSPVSAVLVDSPRAILESTVNMPVRILDTAPADQEGAPAIEGSILLTVGGASWELTVTMATSLAIQHASRLTGGEPGLVSHTALLDSAKELARHVASNACRSLLDYDITAHLWGSSARVAQSLDRGTTLRKDVAVRSWYATHEHAGADACINFMPVVQRCAAGRQAPVAQAIG